MDINDTLLGKGKEPSLPQGAGVRSTDGSWKEETKVKGLVSTSAKRRQGASLPRGRRPGQDPPGWDPLRAQDPPRAQNPGVVETEGHGSLPWGERGRSWSSGPKQTSDGRKFPEEMISAFLVRKVFFKILF